MFTQHMRDPKNNPAPEGVEDRRIAIYRDLVYNNIESFMANNFPVLRKITADEQWHDMLRDYVSHHKAHTPLFPKMPLEFLQYLEHERKEHPEDPPYLLELAHYEWIEPALSIDTRNIDFSNVDHEGNLLEGVPVLNPLSLALEYTWPVHEISPTNLPDTPPHEKTYIVVYRNQDDEVGFMVLNPVSAKLIEYLQSEEILPGREILKKIGEELNHPNPRVVIEGGHDILKEFLNKQILLGTRSQTL
ncbi:MAG: putative DNA-binding domain-containing protein [Proteobacteria bacterium]|nr:putative DNA-binding domain-containing protein [Pseudomonadota bacterium]